MSTLIGKNNSELYAQNLKAIRNAKGISSVEKLSNIIGITARSLGEYERAGRLPSIELVTQLCIKLNVNANWFVTGKGNMFNPPEYTETNDDLLTRVANIEKILSDAGFLSKK